MSDDRCTCGFMSKIEAALERIREAHPVNSGILWEWEDLNRGLLRVYATGQPTIKLRYPCDLPAAILELRDKVDPPIQKARRWRVGDVVQNEERRILARVTGFHQGIADGGFTLNVTPVTTVYIKRGWRNLTIEAERAGEER